MVLPDEEGPYSLERSTLILRILPSTLISTFFMVYPSNVRSRSAGIRVWPADFCPNWHVDRRADGAEVRDHHQLQSAGDVDDDYIFRRMSAIGYSRFLAKAATYGNRRRVCKWQTAASFLKLGHYRISRYETEPKNHP